MKFVIELVLGTIIIFFVWNILKRLFFNSFYKNFPQLNPRNYQKQQEQQSAKSDKKLKEKVKWDAETVDFEEVKEEKK
ncbi:hypothetical protein G6R40_14080 [Chryseobacterium sp. POL2]|uniref:hypothetical protein n=1 Tax=Chryseobacterium sp. POL2 TaxID=2713414 RepID=UPI0013E11362|nr:hypothetical protein [Chryseobacterium sp. POL2]QIG90703.1 hypothetical protein G6R40_14080 [Chryseobacterium sp. POL2]